MKNIMLKLVSMPSLANVILIENGINGMAENVNITAKTRYNVRAGFQFFILFPLFIIMTSYSTII